MVYIASPFFSEEELNNVKLVEKILSDRKIDFFSPRQHEMRGDLQKLAPQIFELDKKMIDKSDCVLVLYYGVYSDSGTAWECGYAYAKDKAVIICHLGKDANIMVHKGSDTNISIDDLKTFDFNFENFEPKDYFGPMM